MLHLPENRDGVWYIDSCGNRVVEVEDRLIAPNLNTCMLDSLIYSQDLGLSGLNMAH